MTLDYIFGTTHSYQQAISLCIWHRNLAAIQIANQYGTAREHLAEVAYSCSAKSLYPSITQPHMSDEAYREKFYKLLKGNTVGDHHRSSCQVWRSPLPKDKAESFMQESKDAITPFLNSVRKGTSLLDDILVQFHTAPSSITQLRGYFGFFYSWHSAKVNYEGKYPIKMTISQRGKEDLEALGINPDNLLLGKVERNTGKLRRCDIAGIRRATQTGIISEECGVKIMEYL